MHPAAEFLHYITICSKHGTFSCNNLSVFLQESYHKRKAFILSGSYLVCNDCSNDLILLRDKSCQNYVYSFSACVNDIIVLGSQASSETEKKKRFVSFKRISTCSLAVVCALICFCPSIVLLALCWMRETSLCQKQFTSLELWVSTSFSMSSTFNCLIFFWRITLLRREGMKIIKCSRDQFI